MNINYMREHASLLPLVLANNKKHLVDVVGTNYYFSCQFHNEKTPSLRIKNVSNTGYCFGCGAKINPFTYLQEYENLKFRKVLQLLAQIYLFDVKYENPKLDSLVSKYQQVIMSEEYLFLLEESLERFNKLSHSSQEIEQVNTVYEYQLGMIERIRNHVYDPDFVYEEPKEYYEKNKTQGRLCCFLFFFSIQFL